MHRDQPHTTTPLIRTPHGTITHPNITNNPEQLAQHLHAAGAAAALLAGALPAHHVDLDNTAARHLIEPTAAALRLWSQPYPADWTLVAHVPYHHPYPTDTR